jgi:hypothetical protein
MSWPISGLLVKMIIKDLSHPSKGLFTLLPSILFKLTENTFSFTATTWGLVTGERGMNE